MHQVSTLLQSAIWDRVDQLRAEGRSFAEVAGILLGWKP